MRRGVSISSKSDNVISFKLSIVHGVVMCIMALRTSLLNIVNRKCEPSGLARWRISTIGGH